MRIVRTATERDTVPGGRDPVRNSGRADLVAEADHTRDRSPAVLAKPAVRAFGTLARAIAAVRRACIVVGVRVGREDGGFAVRLGQREDRGKRVGVVGGLVAELIGVLFGRQAQSVEFSQTAV